MLLGFQGCIAMREHALKHDLGYLAVAAASQSVKI